MMPRSMRFTRRRSSHLLTPPPTHPFLLYFSILLSAYHCAVAQKLTTNPPTSTELLPALNDPPVSVSGLLPRAQSPVQSTTGLPRTVFAQPRPEPDPIQLTNVHNNRAEPQGTSTAPHSSFPHTKDDTTAKSRHGVDEFIIVSGFQGTHPSTFLPASPSPAPIPSPPTSTATIFLSDPLLTSTPTATLGLTGIPDTTVITSTDFVSTTVVLSPNTSTSTPSLLQEQNAGSRSDSVSSNTPSKTLEVRINVDPHPANLDWERVHETLRVHFARVTTTEKSDWRLVGFRTEPPRQLTYQAEFPRSSIQQAAEEVAKLVRGGVAGAMVGVTMSLRSNPSVDSPRREPVPVPNKPSTEASDEENSNNDAATEATGQSGVGSGKVDRSKRDVGMALAGAGGAAGIALLAGIAIITIMAARRRSNNGVAETLSDTSSSFLQEGYNMDEARGTTLVQMKADARQERRTNAMRGHSRTADWESGSDAFSSAEIVAV